MKNNAYFNRVLVTKGDFDFPATGLPLYTIKKGKGRKTRRIYNGAIKVGQPVLWLNPATVGAVPETVDVASITAANIGKLHIGVAVSTGKNGVVDAIREISYGELGGCQIEGLGAYGPKCGLSEIKALYPKCLNCDGLTLKIKVQDNLTRSFLPKRVTEDIIVNYTPQCKECDSCDRTPTCEEFMCGLVDQINGDLESWEINGLPYPGPQARDIDRRVRAAKLHDPANGGQFLSYCIVPESSDCSDKCDRIGALTTFTVDGTAIPFEGLVDSADDSKTLISQLHEAAAQIEEGLCEVLGRHGGVAFLDKGLGNCCGIQLYVSTCDPTFEIAGLTPCEDALEIFPEFTKGSYCQDCSSDEEASTPTCGIAIIGKQYDIDCGCYPEDVPNFPLTTFDIEVIDHENVLSTNFDTAHIQKGRIASNYGTQVQWREYNQKVAGEGFDFLEGNTYSGKLGLPDRNSKINNIITADCEQSYCTYFVRSLIKATTFVRPEERLFKQFGELNVPYGDATTRASVEALFTKFVEVNPQACSDLEAVVCEED